MQVLHANRSRRSRGEIMKTTMIWFGFEQSSRMKPDEGKREKMPEPETSCRKRRRRRRWPNGGTCKQQEGPPPHSATGSQREFINLICAIMTIIAISSLLLVASANESDNSNLIRGTSDTSSQQQSPATTTTTTTSNSSSTSTTTTTTAATTTTTTTTTTNPTPSSSSMPNLSAVLRRDLGAKSQQQQQQLQQTATNNVGQQGRRNDGVCQVNDGESVAIMEIEESRGSEMDQTTNPIELPIGGSLDEIELKIESETHKYFHIQDKSLRLSRPLDRDAILKENSTQTLQQPITSIYLQISCVDKRQQQQHQARPAKKAIIPVLVKVLDLNDNAPKFSQPVYSVQVNELAPIGTVILDQVAFAVDLDSANNGQIEYSLLGATSQSLPSSKSIVPPKFVSAASQTNQRLVQRAEPAQGPTNQDQQASSTARLVATTAVSTASTLPSKQPMTTTTMTPPVGAESSTRAENDDDDDAEEGEAGSQSVSTAPQESSQGGPAKSLGEPTINLNSEPIMNGPMEESEEDESDEALLASINAANNSTDTDGGEPPVGDQSDFASSSARALLPRLGKLGSVKPAALHGHLKRARRQLQTTAETTTRRKQLQMTTTMFNSMSSTRVPPFEAAFSSSGQPPWTNLMVIPSEEFQSIEALGRQEFPEEDSAHSSNDFFELELSTQTNRPVIRLKRQLDYETKRLHQLTLVATDRAQNKNERLSSQVKILIRVLDGDDQPPAFILDQVGCATGQVTQATSPLPPMEKLEQPDVINGSAIDLLQQEAAMDHHQKLASLSPLAASLGPRRAISSLRSTIRPAAMLTSGDLSVASTNLRLRSFKVTDENFDFGDTLGLDDIPLEHEGGAGDEQTTAVAAAHQQVGNARTRRITTSPALGQQQSSVSVIKSQTPQASQLLDYLCLASTGASKSAGSGGGGQQLAEYFATVISGDSDYLLRVAPQSIKARDRDELNASIRYSFINGTPSNYSLYFQINTLDATIKQVAPIERTHVNEFTLFIKAEEQSLNKLFSVAKLTIDVLPTDKSPPVLVPNSYSGFVNENSPIGSRVLIAPSQQNHSLTEASYMRIGVLDADKLPSLQAKYDFETTSDSFKVDRDGYVYVNRFPLDRDLPGSSVHMFQVTARQAGLVSSRSISSPISLNITLGDLNDNPPQLQNSTLGPIQMTANSRGGAQHLVQLEALDRDLPENSQMHFSIQHVSNMGSARFRIDEESGRIEALGKFQAGEQFSLTVQVADDLGRSSQGIVDVQVVPGANTGGPQFLTEGALRAAFYSVEVNEGVAVNSVILQVRAIDPENDPISYSIIDGNINGDFTMNSKTGALVVANKLDREEISAYKLIVQARDSGGLATSRPIHVLVTDSNDQNPIFNQAQYVFAVDEGVPSMGAAYSGGHLLGRVSAHDSDEGDNGRVSYSLMHLDSSSSLNAAPYAVPTSSLESIASTGSNSLHQSEVFAIDSTSGDLRLMQPLDYERSRSHTLLVVARDHGENPRSSSAMVQVRVLDRQDEPPYFERYHLEVRLDENQPNQRVGLVQARDPDSVAEITYVLLVGDSSLFQVDPQTGLVTTTSTGLDYEQARSHRLLIGTNESLTKIDLDEAIPRLESAISAKQTGGSSNLGSGQSLERSPLIRIEVLVNDLNDNAPQFESGDLMMPVRVQDSVALGSILPAQIRAHDLDGSSPNNQIRYELVTSQTSSSQPPQTYLQQFTSDRCAQLFLVDPSSGQISVRADLKRDTQSECQLIIRARDLPQQGQQSLSSFVSLTVYIDHLIEISAASMIGFADSSYTVELAENAPANSLVKLLTIINKPKVATTFPMSCEILSGNELSRFYVTENEQRDCELRTRDQLLDFEQRQKYTLMVKLNTVGGGSSASSGSRSTLAQIQVNILDKNDNRPTFANQPSRYSHLTQNKFLAAIAYDSPSETQLIQLRASDLDSSQANGLISYELLNEQELEGRFKVDPMDGILRTSRPIEDIPATRLPIRLKVLARDNPEQANESLDAIAEVVVNLIDDHHRIALVLKDTPASRVLDNKEELLSVLQERTGLISGLERVESLKAQRNLSLIEADVSGSDVWFYLIEPGSLRIVPNDDPRLKATLFEHRAQNSLADIINQNLAFAKARIRLPYSITNAINANAQSGSSNLLFGAIRADSNDRLAPILILVSLFIAIISAIVVIYQCGSVAGFSESTNNQQYLSHQHFAKDKFLFAPPPPSQYQFVGSTLGGDIAQTPLGSLSRAHSSDQYGLTRSSFGPTGDGGAPFALLNSRTPNDQQQLTSQHNKDTASSQMRAKEYETQMLKMSVLFDDSQSFDEQNMNDYNNVNKNLV